jgi:micrococcal nuclease
MTPAQPYTFKATLHHVWDGDTIWLIIDRGEGWQSKGKYRLFGVDTPEIRGVTVVEEAYAKAAKMFVEDLLRDKDLVVSTLKGKSKYDWMVDIWVEGRLLSSLIIEAGHGVEYGGETKLPWETRKAMQDEARKAV